MKHFFISWIGLVFGLTLLTGCTLFTEGSDTSESIVSEENISQQTVASDSLIIEEPTLQNIIAHLQNLESGSVSFEVTNETNPVAPGAVQVDSNIELYKVFVLLTDRLLPAPTNVSYSPFMALSGLKGSWLIFGGQEWSGTYDVVTTEDGVTNSALHLEGDMEVIGGNDFGFDGDLVSVDQRDYLRLNDYNMNDGQEVYEGQWLAKDSAHYTPIPFAVPTAQFSQYLSHSNLDTTPDAVFQPVSEEIGEAEIFYDGIRTELIDFVTLAIEREVISLERISDEVMLDETSVAQWKVVYDFLALRDLYEEQYELNRVDDETALSFYSESMRKGFVDNNFLVQTLFGQSGITISIENETNQLKQIELHFHHTYTDVDPDEQFDTRAIFTFAELTDSSHITAPDDYVSDIEALMLEKGHTEETIMLEQQWENVKDIFSALHRFHLEHEQYPETLGELIGLTREWGNEDQEIVEIPHDLFTGYPFQYQIQGREYELTYTMEIPEGELPSGVYVGYVEGTNTMTPNGFSAEFDETADSDEDGLTNAEEDKLGTDAHYHDTDDDLIWDGQEVEDGTDPFVHTYTANNEAKTYISYHPDIADERRLFREFPYAVEDDPTGDVDGDGLSNIEEWEGDTAVYRADTDRDGYDDGAEIAAGFNPVSPADDGARYTDSKLHPFTVYRRFEKVVPLEDVGISITIPEAWHVYQAVDPQHAELFGTETGYIIDTFMQRNILVQVSDMSVEEYLERIENAVASDIYLSDYREDFNGHGWAEYQPKDNFVPVLFQGYVTDYNGKALSVSFPAIPDQNNHRLVSELRSIIHDISFDNDEDLESSVE